MSLRSKCSLHVLSTSLPIPSLNLVRFALISRNTPLARGGSQSMCKSQWIQIRGWGWLVLRRCATHQVTRQTSGHWRLGSVNPDETTPITRRLIWSRYFAQLNHAPGTAFLRETSGGGTSSELKYFSVVLRFDNLEPYPFTARLRTSPSTVNVRSRCTWL